MKYISIFILILTSKIAMSDFFKNITNLIENNTDRLSYGVSVADINNDNNFEFIVAGFRYPNLALGFRDGVLKNLINKSIFSDEKRSTIGVASCDIDQDGIEETYFLNTDTYSGEKKYSDRLLNFSKEITDLFELPKNKKNLNLTAGRSVVCVDSCLLYTSPSPRDTEVSRMPSSA